MRIAFLNQKGGPGKTTLATNIARGFQILLKEEVLLIDSDPQGSARDWHNATNGELLPVVGLDRPTLPKDINNISSNFKWIFIDGAGRLEAMTASAIKCSDLVLIPVRPSPYDVWGSEECIDLVKSRQEVMDGYPKAAFIINCKIPNTILGKDVLDALKKYDLPVLETHIFQRQSYARTAAEGKTVFDINNDPEATKEMKKLVYEIKEFAQCL
jgi:chromosome partitioning protein